MCHFRLSNYFFFFFNDTATTEIYTLSLHDVFRSAAGPAQGQLVGDGGVVLDQQQMHEAGSWGLLTLPPGDRVAPKRFRYKARDAVAGPFGRKPEGSGHWAPIAALRLLAWQTAKRRRRALHWEPSGPSATPARSEEHTSELQSPK